MRGFAEADLVEQACVDHFLLHVVGEAEQHRAGVGRQQNLRRLPQDLEQVVGALDDPVVARDAAEQGRLVDAAAFAGTLLQAALAENESRGFAGDDQDGQLFRVGIGNAGDQVGGAGAGRRDAGADAARGAGMAAGHERRALFVLDQYARDTRSEKVIVDRQDVRAGHAVDMADSQALHEADDECGDGDLHWVAERKARI